MQELTYISYNMRLKLFVLFILFPFIIFSINVDVGTIIQSLRLQHILAFNVIEEPSTLYRLEFEHSTFTNVMSSDRNGKQFIEIYSFGFV